MDAYIDICSKANRTIHIIDDYVGHKTLHLLQGTKDNVAITLMSDNKGNYLKESDYQDFIKEFPNNPITFICSNNVMHDRFIVLDYMNDDEHVFHCGASSKDVGNRITSIMEFNDKEVKKSFNKLLNELLSNQTLR